MKALYSLTLVGFVLLFFAFSCQKEPVRLKEQVWLDSLVNNSPLEAIHQIEQLKKGNYQHATKAERMKLEMMKVKAGDKAYILKTSDDTTQLLVDYYEQHGTANELMEAYLYHGSAYRDLRDTPRALKFYLKAVETADTTDADFDWYQYSMLLEQLAEIYSLQYDFIHAIECHQEILRIGGNYESDLINDLGTLGRYYDCADSLQQAHRYYSKALAGIKKEEDKTLHLPMLGEILGFYERRNLLKEGEVCYQLMKTFDRESLPPNTCSAIGIFLKKQKRWEEALHYLTYLESYSAGPMFMYGLKRALFDIYRQIGDTSKASQYAYETICYADSVEIMQMYEQARQINHAFQYYKDSLREQSLLHGIQQRNLYILLILVVALLFLFSGVVVYNRRIHKRNRTIAEQLRTIQGQHISLGEKDGVIKQLENEQQDKDLQLKSLETQLEQHKTIALSVAEVLADFIAPDGSGIPVKDESSWRNLFKAVDKEFPHFLATMHQLYPGISPFDQRMLYLAKTGLKTKQITDILERSAGVFSQHCKRLENEYGVDPRNFLNDY